MAISSEISRMPPYTGNGTTDTFAYSFKVFDDDDLLVFVEDTSTNTLTTLTKTTHYTVTGAGDSSGGNVVLVSGAFDWLDAEGDLDTGWRLYIRRRLDLVQETDLRNQDDYHPEDIEDELDRLVMRDQQQQDEIDRSLRLPESVTDDDFDNEFPAGIVAAAGKLPMINADSDGWADPDDWPTADAIAEAQENATAAAASATAAATSATNAATSATNAATSASAAQAAAESVIWRDVIFITNADSPYTIDEDHRGKLIAADCSDGAISITLPEISGLDLTSAFAIAVKKTDTSGNGVTVARSGTDTVDGGTSKTILGADSGAVFIPDVDPTPDEWTTTEFGFNSGNYTVDRFSGDGSETEFTLSNAPGSENNTFVYVDGEYQQKNTYSVSGTTLTFASAPASGTDNIEIISGLSLAIGVPGDQTVTTEKLDENVFSGLTSVTPVAADTVVISDASDSNHNKKASVSALRNAVYRSVTTTDSVGSDDETMVLSGASFTSTIPTAVGVAGKRYKFVHGGTSLTQVYTLATTSSQTIGGIAGGSYALYTNGEVLEIESDGANWIIVNHYTKTGEVDAGAISVTATTTNPTKGTTSLDKVIWHRDGSFVNITYRYMQTTAGNGGSGFYLYALPSNLAPDTTYLPVATTINSSSTYGEQSRSNIGHGEIGFPTAQEPFQLYLYSTTQFAAYGRIGTTWQSAANYAYTNDELGFAFHIRYRVTGWQP